MKRIMPVVLALSLILAIPFGAFAQEQTPAISGGGSASTFTLSIGNVTIHADGIKFDSQTGQGVATGDVTLEANGSLKIGVTNGSVELSVEQTTRVLTAHISGHASASMKQFNGSFSGFLANNMNFKIKF